MLSHELRTPLGAILNATELLERRGGDGGGPSSSAHDVIRRQAPHMGRLIDDLLDVGRITRQQLVLQSQIVDFRDVIRDAIDVVRRDADRKQLELCCSLPSEALTVCGDPVRLRQIATNLVVNAVGYTSSGSVHVEASRSNGSVSLAVRDTGVGLAPDELGRVFRAVLPGAAAARPAARRAGRGAEPRAAAGDTCTTAPSKCTATAVARGACSRSTPFAARVARRAPDAAQPPKLRIVIVEDNDDNREMLVELLRSEGHRVWATDNGITGTELILAERPDVALVDVGLPGLDGFSVASRVREVASGLIRLVALTGYGLPQDRARAADAGFDRHILKPIEPNALFRVLHEVSRGNQRPS